MPSVFSSMEFAIWQHLFIALTDASTWRLYPRVYSLPPSPLDRVRSLGFVKLKKLANQEKA